MSYSICCSAEQSGAAGGGQASLHRGGGGETTGERRGWEAISSAPLQHLEGEQSGTGPAEDTRSHPQRQSDERPGQRVEVKRELRWDRGLIVPSAPPPKCRLVLRGTRRSSLEERGRLAPQVLFLLTLLPPLTHHGRMDDFGEAAGGGCPAALYYDWKVRR